MFLLLSSFTHIQQFFLLTSNLTVFLKHYMHFFFFFSHSASIHTYQINMENYLATSILEILESNCFYSTLNSCSYFSKFFLLNLFCSLVNFDIKLMKPCLSWVSLVTLRLSYYYWRHNFYLFFFFLVSKEKKVVFALPWLCRKTILNDTKI